MMFGWSFYFNSIKVSSGGSVLCTTGTTRTDSKKLVPVRPTFTVQKRVVAVNLAYRMQYISVTSSILCRCHDLSAGHCIRWVGAPRTGQTDLPAVARTSSSSTAIVISVAQSCLLLSVHCYWFFVINLWCFCGLFQNVLLFNLIQNNLSKSRIWMTTLCILLSKVCCINKISK